RYLPCRPLRLCARCPLPLRLFLRVLRVLRGQKVYHHEEHEGDEVSKSSRQDAKIAKTGTSFFSAESPEAASKRPCLRRRRLYSRRRGYSPPGSGCRA